MVFYWIFICLSLIRIFINKRKLHIFRVQWHILYIYPILWFVRVVYGKPFKIIEMYMKSLWKTTTTTKNNQHRILFKRGSFFMRVFFDVLFFNFHKWKMLTKNTEKKIKQEKRRRLKRTRFISHFFLSSFYCRSKILFAVNILMWIHLILFTPLEEQALFIISFFSHVSF